jgi:hypothetical protein
MGHSIPTAFNKDLGAPWIDTAQVEIGQKETGGAKANPRILEYFKASRFWGKMTRVRRMLGVDRSPRGLSRSMDSFRRKTHFELKSG